MIHVRFQPGSLFKLFKVPMTELVHQNIEAELIVGNEIRQVHEKLVESSSYGRMIEIVNHFFLEQISKIQHDIRPIDNIGQLIWQKPSAFCLEEAARQSCLSHRRFERSFTQMIGVTPKYYARICRFYQAYEIKEYSQNLDWLSVAVRTGYTDYQHLSKDFKEFASTTPNALISASSKDPERMLNIATNFRGV